MYQVNKMRKTKNKEKILQLLSKAKKAYTAQEIHKELDAMDLATVYRNLNKFVEEGRIRELRIRKGESIYEINIDNHEHAVCNKCGKLKHINIDKDKLKSTLDLKDFEIEDIEINIKGHCK